MFKRIALFSTLICILSMSLAACNANVPSDPPTDAHDQQALLGGQPPEANGQQARPGGQQMPDLAVAAAQLGVTEEVLQDALGNPPQGGPDLAAPAAPKDIREIYQEVCSSLIDSEISDNQGAKFLELMTKLCSL